MVPGFNVCEFDVRRSCTEDEDCILGDCLFQQRKFNTWGQVMQAWADAPNPSRSSLELQMELLAELMGDGKNWTRPEPFIAQLRTLESRMAVVPAAVVADEIDELLPGRCFSQPPPHASGYLLSQ